MSSFKKRLGDIIFEHNTRESYAFDVVLLIAIALSIVLIMLESVASVRLEYGQSLRLLEWVFTIFFTVEYIARVYTAKDRRKYLFSFFGIVDLLAILPTYLSLFIEGPQYFIMIRALRLLRIFRVLKLVRFMGEANTLNRALKASREKIIVFVIAVITLVMIIGAVMYLVEGPENGFNNIPLSVYWAIVTLTTVGYGDIAPQTPLGQFLSALVMILGYGIIAVPTGIVTTELARASSQPYAVPETITCTSCSTKGHDIDAAFCKYCGEGLKV